MRFAHSKLLRAAALAILALLGSTNGARAAGDWFNQVKLGLPANTGAEAQAGIDGRAATVVRWNACGLEIEFLSAVINDRLDKDRKPEDHSTGEGIIGKAIGKVAYLHGDLHNNPPPCVVNRWVRSHEFIFTQALADAWEAGEKDNPVKSRAWFQGHIDQFNQRFRDEFRRIAPGRDDSEACQFDPLSIADDNQADADVYLLRFEGRADCLRLQVNAAVMKMHVIGNIGTDKLPCNIFGEVPGDWDATVKELVRLYFLDRNMYAAVNLIYPAVLDDNAREHIVNDLFTIDGETHGESYSLWECGDDERSTGSPQERADERDWYDDDPVIDAIGDILDWLWNRKVLFVGLAVLMAAGAIGAAITQSIAPFVAAAVAGGVVGTVLAFVRIPETENHLLMINTSRYLINQVIIDGLSSYEDRHPWEEDQKDVREWLLKRLQKIAEEDFREYNARPYQRYSILAILNLHDFAKATELRIAAHGILEFATAKFAVSSAQGRRIVPFRRRMEVLEDDQFVLEGDTLPRSMFDGATQTDYQLIQELLFAGPSIHMPPAWPPPNPGSFSQYVVRAASVPSVSIMIYGATSRYRPEETTLDIAVNKRDYQQYFHHDGVEVYSSSPSFFVTAGGIEAGPSDRIIVPPGVSVPGPWYLCMDLGTGVPTTLMPRVGKRRVQATELLRIGGGYYEYDRDGKVCTGRDFRASQPLSDRGVVQPNRKHMWTHDFNACVFSGFACGTNIVVPADMDNLGCMRDAAGLPSTWKFFDSANCAPYQGDDSTGHFFAVIYREFCPSNSEKCVENWGFFYAVEASRYASFDDFRSKIVSLNQPHLPFDGEERSGHFSSGFVDVEFDADANQDDSDDSGIVKVSGVEQPQMDDWSLASGDVIDAADGLITIKKPGGGGVRIDLTTWWNPKYATF